MKPLLKQLALILLALLIIGAVIYLVPFTLGVFSNPSYRFVLIFILLVLTSNILAKLTTFYINS